VINFDYPNTAEDYVHRIGRTARASSTGTAYTFITPNDSKNIDELIDILTEAKQDVPHALMMMKECFGGSKPDKKQWVKRGGKRRQYEGDVPVSKKLAHRSMSRSGSESDSADSNDSERRRKQWPETEDDWAALYNDNGEDPFGRDVPRDKQHTGKPLPSWDPASAVQDPSALQDTVTQDPGSLAQDVVSVTSEDGNFGLGDKVAEQGEFNVMVDDNVIDWQCLENDTQVNPQI